MASKDEKLVSLLNTIDDYINSRADPSSRLALSDAFLNLSIAKKTCEVSKDFYDWRMSASAVVSSPYVDADGELFGFRLLNDVRGSNIEEDSKGNLETSTLRNRKKNVKDDKIDDYQDDARDSGDGNEDEKEKKKSKPPIKNPINWFGILVPSALRISQNKFKLVLEDYVALANITMKINNLLSEIEQP